MFGETYRSAGFIPQEFLRFSQQPCYSIPMKVLWFVALLIALLTGCANKHDTASAPETQAAAKPKAILLDVRTPGEYKLEHLPGAVNLPVDQVENKIASIAPDKTTPLTVHCAVGARAARAKAKLDGLGYTNVRNLGSYENARQVLEDKSLH